MRVMCFDFSSVLNVIQPALLRGKLEGAGLDEQLTAWTMGYLTNRPQYVRLHDCQSDVVVCSTRAPQTSDFRYNSDHCHCQKFSDDTAFTGCVSNGSDQEYRVVISEFVGFCETNALQINDSKTKEMVVDFKGSPPPHHTGGRPGKRH